MHLIYIYIYPVYAQLHNLIVTCTLACTQGRAMGCGAGLNISASSGTAENYMSYRANIKSSTFICQRGMSYILADIRAYATHISPCVIAVESCSDPNLDRCER